mmetsp:Transcript_1456/g.1876  ORF Transcript_1456/g.1876 Transcript_1456/m.1876 type:complete len:202 (-) Transcript_1456:1643-2248(-)
MRPQEKAFKNECLFNKKSGFFFSLWRYMIPLFTVYTSEYAMQSGAWAAIGFPITSVNSRKDFYLASNFAYQIGVFISRSSGIFFTLNLKWLWIVPVLQCFLLVFFVVDTMYNFIWDFYILLFLCFVAGLFGGVVYVNAYILITNDAQPRWKEFSVAAASLADTLGIMTATVLGLVIQGCLYGYHSISEQGNPPVFQCGYDY